MYTKTNTYDIWLNSMENEQTFSWNEFWIVFWRTSSFTIYWFSFVILLSDVSHLLNKKKTAFVTSSQSVFITCLKNVNSLTTLWELQSKEKKNGYMNDKISR